MSEGVIKKKPLELSVVIPAYNAAEWLKPTVEKIIVAMRVAANADFEIIIVDDGSSDETKRVAEALLSRNKHHIKVLSHLNQGRYLTRKRGVEAARYPRILFIDTRVWISEDSIKFLKDQLAIHPDRVVWNGHINVAKEGNVIARFGDALTLLGWRRYFKNPQLTSYGLEDFDHYPKGTGLFSAPKHLLTESMTWFERTTSDIKNSSDDTLLIRHIAESERIWLSPQFSGIYFARTTLKAFVKHTYYRGQYFVDGFLRKGTRFYWPLNIFLIFTIPTIILVVIFPVLLGSILALWLLELIVVLFLRLSLADSLSLFILTPIFALFYAAGIWRAVLRRVITRLVKNRRGI